MDILAPPIPVNAEGKPRKAGFEFEYTGIALEESARIIADIFSGSVREESRSDFRVKTQRFGEFKVMLDMSMMQKLSATAAEVRKTHPDNETLETVAESVLAPIVSTWMPNEIVTPPLPFEAIDDMEELCRRIARAGGKGTGASPIYAFGLHINAEMPGIPKERLRDYIAAFIVLQEWLKERTRMDITRQLSSFSRLFGNDYARVVLAPGYAPDFDTLVEDYLRFNNTRNRALDMLPLFAWFDEEKIKSRVGDDRVRKRPTFHYRLPNCNLGEPDWSIMQEWNWWVQVERLAEDAPKLRAASDEYLQWIASPVDALLGGWAQKAAKWVA